MTYIVNWIIGNTLQWNLDKITKIFWQEYAFKHVVYKMLVILFRISMTTILPLKYQRKYTRSTSLAPCEGNPMVTSGFPSQRAIYAENIFNAMLSSWISSSTSNVASVGLLHINMAPINHWYNQWSVSCNSCGGGPISESFTMIFPSKFRFCFAVIQILRKRSLPIFACAITA